MLMSRPHVRLCVSLFFVFLSTHTQAPQIDPPVPRPPPHKTYLAHTSNTKRITRPKHSSKQVSSVRERCWTPRKPGRCVVLVLLLCLVLPFQSFQSFHHPSHPLVLSLLHIHISHHPFPTPLPSTFIDACPPLLRVGPRPVLSRGLERLLVFRDHAFCLPLPLHPPTWQRPRQGLRSRSCVVWDWLVWLSLDAGRGLVFPRHLSHDHRSCAGHVPLLGGDFGQGLFLPLL